MEENTTMLLMITTEVEGKAYAKVVDEVEL